MSSTTSCYGDILKKLITNVAALDVGQIIHITLQLISFSILLACLCADQWLSGYNGHQGLWNYCFKNGTSLCCGKLDNILGYKDFIGATRVFLIIEAVVFLGIFVTIICTVYEIYPVYKASTIFTGIIGFCTFLSVTIYGSQHGDVSIKTSMDLSTSFVFCASNLGLQILIFSMGLCLASLGTRTYHEMN